tara:strand:+ start:3791 stop:5314 length:1524 start_codon:yes stop_codon:yes gene_type:complete
MQDQITARYYPETEVVYPTGVSVLPIADIVIKERGRKDYGDIEGLSQSIKEVGFIAPIVLNQRNELIAGERRLKAHILLGLEHVAYVYRETLTESQELELELAENADRKQMKWHEDTVLIARCHRAKIKETTLGVLDPRALAILEASGKREWGQRQTGNLMGVALGQVSMALRIAQSIEERDEEVLAAPHIKGALDILVKRREDEVLKLSAGMSKTAQTSGPAHSIPTIPSMSSAAPSDAGVLGGGVFDILTANNPAPEISEDTGPITIPISEMFIHADVQEYLPTRGAHSFDHIITDPPYAIDVANMGELKKVSTDIKGTHQVEENLALLEWFIPEAFRVTRDKGCLIMWCDPMHFRQLHDWGLAAGWRVQRWPLIWHKLSACKNQAPHQNTTKNFEFAIRMRKGNAVLNNPVSSSIITADNPEAMMYDNPFAKPFEVWKWLIEMTCLPGQTIGDFFGGNFSLARAAINLGHNPVSCELEGVQYNKGITDIQKLYQTMTMGDVVFT